tara:strand:+ start:101 stop:577 length:477 start_codon:yes stop_codon:yes gene_type:complete
MYKSFILAILSLSILTSCSFNNPLSKKANLVYLECPKSLILAPGKSLTKENINISLSKDYSVDCYFNENSLNDVIFDFNYQLNVNANDKEPILTSVDLWIFLTDKKESKKISENSFKKSFEISENTERSNNISLTFNDSVKLKRSEYDQGIKIFLSLN